MHRTFSPFRSRAAAFAHDLLMAPVAWFAAYWLRFNLESIPDEFWRQALLLLPLVWGAQAGMFWYYGLYRGVWRFASIPDLVRIVKAVTAGLLIAAAASFILTRMQSVPRSVFFLDGILLVLLLGGPRFLYRWSKDRHLYTKEGKLALIVGAGRAGEMLARDMLRDVTSPYRPVAFVDDDRKKIGQDIHGLPVVGTCNDISQATEMFGVDLILIALPTATSRQLRRIVEICESTDLPFRALPRMQDLVSGQVSVRDLRDVTIDDLLGREPVKLDWQAITEGIEGKTILVTGGGGSIGAELCRQIVNCMPAKLVVFERSEFNLYEIDLELRQKYPDLKLISILGDVCDAVAVEKVLGDHEPSAIFHAAAYKHVPMLQDQARIATVNNVFGSRTIAQAAEKFGVGTFVLISSDKAVNPGNIMGLTKRVAEIYCQNLSNRGRTRYITVRFGNVLGSSGSVIPLFQRQITRGGPVTVTHPEVTRFFMTIPEACQLILQAGVIGRGGEIFVLNMGEPIKISYLAEQLIRLSGKTPGEDIDIVYTGLRPGEKLYEELFHEAEKLADTSHPKILLANSRAVDPKVLDETLGSLEQACGLADEQRILELLSKLVPERTEQKSSAPHDKKEAVIYTWKDNKTNQSTA
jgi:FlaA1/EpsC-like NDP-sugar epimerase